MNIEICNKRKVLVQIKMESTNAVMLLVLCLACCFYETSAKTNTAGNIDNTNHLNGDFSELSSNELSTEIDNCHEACLQKVRA